MATVEVQSQALVALERANERRFARSRLCQRIAAGDVTVGSVLADPPLCVRSMAVVDLLCLMHRVGPVRARALLARLAVSEQRQVAELTARQVAELTEHLPVFARDGGGSPASSLEQRSAALRRANEVRSGRARVKRDVAARRVTFAAVVADPPELAAGMRVLDLLLWVPAVGRAKALSALRRARVSAGATFGSLTDRQRAELVAAVPA